ncbi:hypothetical protein C7W93_06845 [Glaciimonas sp. PCH181]|nr:hypothetical protein C7W93_06845 [Glaciimonas sp. PCH181]
MFNPSVNRQWELTEGETRHVIDVTGPLLEKHLMWCLTPCCKALVSLPAYIAIDGLRDGSLVRLLGAFRSPEIGVYALYPSWRFMEAKTRAWIDLLNEEVQPALGEDKAFLGKNC